MQVRARYALLLCVWATAVSVASYTPLGETRALASAGSLQAGQSLGQVRRECPVEQIWICLKALQVLRFCCNRVMHRINGCTLRMARSSWCPKATATSCCEFQPLNVRVLFNAHPDVRVSANGLHLAGTMPPSWRRLGHRPAQPYLPPGRTLQQLMGIRRRTPSKYRRCPPRCQAVTLFPANPGTSWL